MFEEQQKEKGKQDLDEDDNYDDDETTWRHLDSFALRFFCRFVGWKLACLCFCHFSETTKKKLKVKK